MEKVLKLYNYVDGVKDTPFPNKDEQVIVSSFRYDAKRMGGSPTISCTVNHFSCLDKLWNEKVYATFNGERFFIKQVPTSSFSNSDARYKHELELVSERIILDNVYFYDVVSSDVENDKPVSNSSNFSFFGTIEEFAQRLNYSLEYSGIDYKVVIDEGVSSEGKMVSFQDQFFSNAIQEIYNTYNLPYYFVDKEIHIGYTDNTLSKVFKYGVDESLLSIQKQNANYKIVNRVTGVGSADNIPYYYPNYDEKGITNVLYNGEKDIAIVENQGKYKKVKLSDKFLYSTSTSESKSLLDGVSYNISSIEKSASNSGWYSYNVSFFYRITLSQLEKVSFNVSSTLGGTKSLTYEIYKLSGTHVGYFSEETELSLTGGDYNFIIHWSFDYDSFIEFDGEVNELINNYVSSKAQTSEYSSSAWLLNGLRVDIAEYGLSINATPTNGDEITIELVSYIKPQPNLMPSIYRETSGEERFYNAENEKYQIPNTDTYYGFANPYIEGKPKEHIVNFDDIKPTIVGLTNSDGLRIDMFQEFAYDTNDNDETDEEGNYLHPYFFAKLRKFDGDYGFNLFDHAIDEEEMTISMTSGSCGACEFVIGVDENTQKNPVQVNEKGELVRDSNGNVVRSGTPQSVQNNTKENEVWIALRKDINTFGTIMPNATNKYKPSVNDTFVILHIDLPQSYILAAEDRLKDALIKYMSENNSEKFNFSISFSRIFFEENPDILESLNENARLQIEYDGETYTLYVSSFSYTMSNDQPLPEIRVELSDTITVTQNALQTAISEAKHEILTNINKLDALNSASKNFLRKDKDDRSKGTIASNKGFVVGHEDKGLFLDEYRQTVNAILDELRNVANIRSADFASGEFGNGFILKYDKETGKSYFEVDEMLVRKVAYFVELVIKTLSHVGGQIVLSPASMRCSLVEEYEEYYRCYFENERDGKTINQEFVVNDQARAQSFNVKEGTSQNVGNQYYWRLVVGCGDNYIDLSKIDCDEGSLPPQAGDDIVQLGNRTRSDRQNAIILSTVGDDAPSIKQYMAINGYTLNGKEVIKISPYGNVFTGDFVSRSGEDILGSIDDLGTRLDDVANQTDKTYMLWFYEYNPTLENYPASEWIDDSVKIEHLQDIFYNEAEGTAWRFLETSSGVFEWVEITDHETIKALEKAAKAQESADEAQKTADSKIRNFVVQPTPPYDKGDRWSNATYTDSEGVVIYENDDLVCITPKTEDGEFDIADWQPTSSMNSEKAKVYASEFKRLDDKITSSVGEGSTTSEAIKAAQAAADAADAAAKKAQETANSASSAAATAQSTANSANIKATANATAITQTSDYVSLISAAFQKDDNGNLKLDDNGNPILTKAAGVVITSDAASLYATKTTVNNLTTRVTNAESSITAQADQIALKASKSSVDTLSGRVGAAEATIKVQADEIALKATKTSVDDLTGRVTTAEASIKTNADNISLKVSKSGVISAINQTAETIKISASKVELEGKVTFSMLDSDAQTKIDGKVTQTEVDASVKGLKDTLGTLAYKSLVEKAQLGETLIVGGYIKAELIDVDSLVAKKLSATSDSGEVLNINSTGITINDKNGTQRLHIYGADGFAHLLVGLSSGSRTLIQANSVSCSDGTNTSTLSSRGLYLGTDGSISGLALGNVGTVFNSDSDFSVCSGTITLPNPSTKKGKVLFFKLTGTTTIQSSYKIYKGNEYELYSYNKDTAIYSSSFSSRSLFFISDGTAWYEFLTYYRS